MDRRYQVFVSSTYSDLKEERRKVIQTLMEMDCFPAGMEIFPAADEEQWEFIKRVISDCDYYVLISGGRYGSMTSEGISYTEKEYDYAIERGIPVLAFVHENPDEITVARSDIAPEIREKLLSFREKVSKNRLVKYWKAVDELSGLVALSLPKTIKSNPAVGWVRADRVSSEKLLLELNQVRKENEDLRRELKSLQGSWSIPGLELASLDDEFEVFGQYSVSGHRGPYRWELKVKWREIFGLLAPYLLQPLSDGYVRGILGRELYRKTPSYGSSPDLDSQVFQTIKIQLMGLNLVDVNYSATIQGGADLFWSLTQKGKSVMMAVRSVQKKA